MSTFAGQPWSFRAENGDEPLVLKEVMRGIKEFIDGLKKLPAVILAKMQIDREQEPVQVRMRLLVVSPAGCPDTETCYPQLMGLEETLKGKLGGKGFQVDFNQITAPPSVDYTWWAERILRDSGILLWDPHRLQVYLERDGKLPKLPDILKVI